MSDKRSKIGVYKYTGNVPSSTLRLSLGIESCGHSDKDNKQHGHRKASQHQDLDIVKLNDVRNYRIDWTDRKIIEIKTKTSTKNEAAKNENENEHNNMNTNEDNNKKGANIHTYNVEAIFIGNNDSSTCWSCGRVAYRKCLKDWTAVASASSQPRPYRLNNNYNATSRLLDQLSSSVTNIIDQKQHETTKSWTNECLCMANVTQRPQHSHGMLNHLSVDKTIAIWVNIATNNQQQQQTHAPNIDESQPINSSSDINAEFLNKHIDAPSSSASYLLCLIGLSESQRTLFVRPQLDQFHKIYYYDPSKSKLISKPLLTPLTSPSLDFFINNSVLIQHNDNNSLIPLTYKLKFDSDVIHPIDDDDHSKHQQSIASVKYRPDYDADVGILRHILKSVTNKDFNHQSFPSRVSIVAKPEDELNHRRFMCPVPNNGTCLTKISIDIHKAYDMSSSLPINIPIYVKLNIYRPSNSTWIIINRNKLLANKQQRSSHKLQDTQSVLSRSFDNNITRGPTTYDESDDSPTLMINVTDDKHDNNNRKKIQSILDKQYSLVQPTTFLKSHHLRSNLENAPKLETSTNFEPEFIDLVPSRLYDRSNELCMSDTSITSRSNKYKEVNFSLALQYMLETTTCDSADIDKNTNTNDHGYSINDRDQKTTPAAAPDHIDILLEFYSSDLFDEKLLGWSFISLPLSLQHTNIELSIMRPLANNITDQMRNMFLGSYLSNVDSTIFELARSNNRYLLSTQGCGKVGFSYEAVQQYSDFNMNKATQDILNINDTSTRELKSSIDSVIQAYRRSRQRLEMSELPDKSHQFAV